MAARFPTKVTFNVRGQSGDLATQLDSALVTLGWTIQATASNRRIYAPGSGGTGMCVYLDDNAISSGREAVMRLCQSTSTLPFTLVNPCPSVAQRSNATCRVRKSNTADATDRSAILIGDSRFFALIINYAGFGGARETVIFGDLEGGLPSDAYNAIALVKPQTDTDLGFGQAFTSSTTSNYAGTNGVERTFTARNMRGNVISDLAAIVILGNSSGFNGGLGAFPHPFTTGIHYTTVSVISSGSASATQSSDGGPRGLVPFVFDSFLQSVTTGLADGDTWTDTAYDPGGLFEIIDTVFNNGGLAASGAVIFQTDGTWDPQAMRPI
jgi:hypothetical protein